MAGKAGRFVQKALLSICSALAVLVIVAIILAVSIPPNTYKISDQNVSSNFYLWFGEHLITPEMDAFYAGDFEEFAHRMKRHLHHWWFSANLQSRRLWVWARTVTERPGIGTQVFRSGDIGTRLRKLPGVALHDFSLGAQETMPGMYFRGYALRLALWYPLVLFSTYPLWCFAKFLVRAHRRYRYRCEQCGYQLHGNVSGCCPECGKTIPATLPT